MRASRRDINHGKEQKFTVGVRLVCPVKPPSVTHIEIHTLVDTYTCVQGNSVSEGMRRRELKK